MSKDRGIGVIGHQDVVPCSYVGSAHTLDVETFGTVPLM
jgi:hypothetical protein